MAETIPGGAYQAADGTWHDAQGNKLSKEQVKDAEELLAKQAEQREAEEAAEQARLAAARQIVVVQSAKPAKPSNQRSAKSKAES